jgi:predicted GNAT family acetyltransferase
VTDVPEASRYELRLDDEVVSFADYHHVDGVVTVPHVETVPHYQGNDYAAMVMAGLLDDLRARGLTIRPLCPYARSYLADHPDQADLIATSTAERS